MKHEKSFGIIPLRREDGNWQVFLVKHRKGEYWSFPKGHGKEGEEEREAAKRELREETNLEVLKFFEKEFFEEYDFMRGDEKIFKRVKYFLAESKGDVKLQSDEILDGRWFFLEDGCKMITFEESRKICYEVKEFL
jgi:8-oxo-dGTP pyrophosphatase MutT (NUDIX family)